MKQLTDRTAETSIVVLNWRQTRIAVRDGNTIKLEIKSVPIMRMPNTTVMAVRKAIIILYNFVLVSVAIENVSSKVTAKIR